MLTALIDKNQFCNLAESWRREDLEQLRSKETFRCPVCQSEVIMKLGTKKIWHFSHKKDSSCRDEYEPESMYHLFGKKQLYRWLDKQDYEPELEKHFPLLNQRPDLYLPSQSPAVAIEYQCSSLSTELLQKRTSSYIQGAIDAVWILGEKRISRVNETIYRLDDLALNALQYPSDDSRRPYLLYYCPLTSAFTILHSIIPYSSQTIFAARKTIPLHKSLYPIAIPSPQSLPTDFISPWVQKVFKTRLYLHVNRDESVVRLKHRLIESGAVPSLFPIEAGVPSDYMYWFETPSYVWQTILLIDIIKPLPAGSSFQFRDVYQPFLHRIKKYRIKVRHDLHSDSHLSYALMDYLKWLRKSGVLGWGGKGRFVKKRDPQFPKTVVEAKDQLRGMILTCMEG
ncbi:competence protein CoiA [Pseudalkalibacillus sp. Hm43]|uniref:competence protein CoiA n=1 Tax=Pseudalkalibacillus sp. Hm43 TaxID=3450742 RepID=UPI003F4392C9